MFNKAKQMGDQMKQMQQVNKLQKQLAEIKAEGVHGDIKVVLKGAIAMSQIESIEIGGEELTDLNKAIKKANKEMNKKMRKLAKSGELNMAGMGM